MTTAGLEPRFPDQVKSVEFVSVGVAPDGRPLYSYQEYEGNPLKRVTSQEAGTLTDRTAYLLSQRALSLRLARAFIHSV
jgi:hypothetical protein